MVTENAFAEEVDYRGERKSQAKQGKAEADRGERLKFKPTTKERCIEPLTRTKTSDQKVSQRHRNMKKELEKR